MIKAVAKSNSLISVRLNVVFLLVSTVLANDENNWNPLPNCPFIPSHEWQTVESDHILPPGLHVRINVQTGHKEARLMPDTDTSTDKDMAALILTENESVSSINKPLKEIEMVQHVPEDIQVENEKTRTRYRSYDELRKDFEKIRSNFESEANTLRSLMTELNKTAITEGRLLTVLEDLDYLLHNVDNGQVFADHNGFSVLRKLIGTWGLTVQKSALSALGAAVQSNAKVKVTALRNGVLDDLRSLFYRSMGPFATDESEVKALELGIACISSLGALLRDFPSAQKHFFHPSVLAENQQESNGFEILSQLTGRNVSKTLEFKLWNLRVRVMNLLGDISLEITNARREAMSKPSTNNEKLWKLYAKVPFDTGLNASGWCARVCSSLLYDIQPGLTQMDLSNEDTVNHDHREKLLSSFLHLSPFCTDAFTSHLPQLDQLLERLQTEYVLRSQVKLDQLDFFFSDMLQLVIRVRNALNLNDTSAWNYSPKNDL